MIDRHQQIRKIVHDARGAISVFETFLHHLDPANLSQEMQELQSAAHSSLKKLRESIESLAQVE